MKCTIFSLVPYTFRINSLIIMRDILKFQMKRMTKYLLIVILVVHYFIDLMLEQLHRRNKLDLNKMRKIWLGWLHYSVKNLDFLVAKCTRRLVFKLNESVFIHQGSPDSPQIDWLCWDEIFQTPTEDYDL